ncbi:MAG: class I SAM-dependent methyltransferase [Candidatus Promineifilaceae bacterium]
MNETIYDKHRRFYLDFVDRLLADESSLWHLLLARIEAILGGRLDGARVCDIACGEGYLSRFLAERGAREVVGVDISAALIEAANQRNRLDNLSYHMDNAHHLSTLPDNGFDIAVSQMAMMDIPDYQAMFRAVHRVLKPGGVFLFTLLHPCFEGPYLLPGEEPFLEDSEGNMTACVVRWYGREGFWQSGGDGVRGHMGAYHRTVSTYINDLISAGFRLEKLEEPLMEGGGLMAQVPKALVVVGTAE